MMELKQFGQTLKAVLFKAQSLCRMSLNQGCQVCLHRGVKYQISLNIYYNNVITPNYSLRNKNDLFQIMFYLEFGAYLTVQED